MQSDDPLVTFVDPGPLNWVTRACLKSAVRCGHTVHAYAYGEVADLPTGVECKDANAVIPSSEMFIFDGITQPGQVGSLAPFSDALRYKLINLGLGTWVDWDVYFIKSLDISKQTLLGWEGPRPFGSALNPYSAMVGNAIMRLDPGSPIILDLVDLTSKPYKMPPWLSPLMKRKVRKKLAGHPFYPGAIRYAEYGPIALNYYVKKHKMKSLVREYDYHYPVDYRDVRVFLQDDETFREALPERTETVHLWNSAFRKINTKRPPKNSFAARLREESLDA